jgi:DNA modification methylase
MTETLYQGDCIEVMRSLESDSVDMIFADPPFNVGKKYGGDSKADKMSPEEYYKWCNAWIEEGYRLLKTTGSFYLMTIDTHLEKLFPMMGSKGVFINLIKWKNVSAEHNPRIFWRSTQPILLYGKSRDYKFNTYAQTRTKRQTFGSWSESRSARSKNQMLDYWDDIPLVYAGSITHPEAILQPGTNKKAHLAQMPVNLADRAILFSTDQGDTVLDPFNGSGSTGASCIKLNRDFVGIEKIDKYIKLARDRWDKLRSQEVLF